MAKIFVITKDYCDYEGLGELSRQEIKAAATLEDAKTIAKQMWKEEEDWVNNVVEADWWSYRLLTTENYMMYKDAICELIVDIHEVEVL